MLADFYSKALQGKLFHKYRNVLMGWEHISTLIKTDEDPSPKERVENNMSEGSTTENTNERKQVTWADVVRGNKESNE